MSKLAFSYYPATFFINGRQEEIFIPLIPIRISKDHGNPTGLIEALVDSGSDRNLFPLRLGKFLGINFSKVKPKLIHGIGNSVIKAYTAEINIWVNNVKYKTDVDFSPDQRDLLLGRQGFFTLFKSVLFDEHGRFVYFETF